MIAHFFIISAALCIGSWIGAIVGILAIAMCQSSAKADKQMEQFIIQNVDKWHEYEVLK